MSDTGAYFAGRFFGKNKLFERVSPKKTMEGAFGGYLASLLGASVVKLVGLPNVGWLHLVLCTTCVCAMGVLGDLIESMLKRASGVKDSGESIPTIVPFLGQLSKLSRVREGGLLKGATP